MQYGCACTAKIIRFVNRVAKAEHPVWERLAGSVLVLTQYASSTSANCTCYTDGDLSSGSICEHTMLVLIEVLCRGYRHTMRTGIEVGPIVQEIQQRTRSVVSLIRMMLQARHDHYEDGIGTKAAVVDVCKTSLIQHGLDYCMELLDVRILGHASLHILPCTSAVFGQDDLNVEASGTILHGQQGISAESNTGRFVAPAMFGCAGKSFRLELPQIFRHAQHVPLFFGRIQRARKMFFNIIGMDQSEVNVREGKGHAGSLRSEDLESVMRQILAHMGTHLIDESFSRKHFGPIRLYVGPECMDFLIKPIEPSTKPQMYYADTVPVQRSPKRTMCDTVPVHGL